jgi:hypothetical protein
MNYIVPETADVREILRNLKSCDGSVVIPAGMLRGLLHELQIRRKQMSKPKKTIKNNFAKPEPIRLFSFKNPSTMRCYVP